MHVNDSISEISARAPKQNVIVDFLKAKILSGEWGPGARLPTHLELADQFAVSSVTIQRGLDHLRNDGFIIPRGRLGSFVVETPPHLHRYGLVFSVTPNEHTGRSPSTRFLDAMAQAAMRYGHETGEQMVFYTGVDHEVNSPGYRKLAADVRARRIAGLIFMTSSRSYNAQLMKGSGVPCVAFGSREPWPGLSTFYVDVEAFICKALDLMVQRKRKRVALMVIAEILPAIVDCFHREAEARGLETGPQSVIGLDPHHPQWAKSTALLMLNQSPSKRPDGLIISDDHLVAGAAQGVLESGVSIPRDIDTVGYWNFTHTAPDATFITRLGCDVSETLRTCIGILEAQRRGERVPKVTCIEPTFEAVAGSAGSGAMVGKSGTKARLSA